MNPLSAVTGSPAIDPPARSAHAPVPAQPATAADPPDPAQQVRDAAQQLHAFLQQSGHEMKFTVDPASGKTIVRIYNTASGELLQQIPSEVIVRIAAILRAEERGAGVDVHI